MRKSLLAGLAAAALTIPAIASAQFTHGQHAPWADHSGYANKGQCQAAMQQFRNKLRDNPELRDPGNRQLSGGEWNRLFDSHWQCTSGQGGRWYVTWAPQ